MRFFHLAILHHERVSLAPIVTEEGAALKSEIEGLG